MGYFDNFWIVGIVIVILLIGVIYAVVNAAYYAKLSKNPGAISASQAKSMTIFSAIVAVLGGIAMIIAIIQLIMVMKPHYREMPGHHYGKIKNRMADMYEQGYNCPGGYDRATNTCLPAPFVGARQPPPVNINVGQPQTYPSQVYQPQNRYTYDNGVPYNPMSNPMMANPNPNLTVNLSEQ
jgi:hypothetical protein